MIFRYAIRLLVSGALVISAAGTAATASPSPATATAPETDSTVTVRPLPRLADAMKPGPTHGAGGSMQMSPGGTASVGPITITGAHVRASLGRAPNTAAYLILQTNGPAGDRLIAVASPAAKKAELHTSEMDDKGILHMHPIKAVAVSPGSPAMLKPGGNHIMLFGVVSPLKAGQSIKLTLTFEKAGTITMAVPVRALGGMGHGGHRR